MGDAKIWGSLFAPLFAGGRSIVGSNHKEVLSKLDVCEWGSELDESPLVVIT